jgi:predicted porin
VHQEVHNDFFGGSNNIPITALQNTGTAGAHSKDKATRASGELRFPTWRVTLDVARLQYKESGQTPGVARFEEYKHTNWAIGWDGGFGPWRFAVQYIQGGEGSCKLTIGDCSTEGLKGKQLNGGVRYRFDRQTFVYFIASRLTNDKSARYDNWSADNPTRGGDIDQVALGISYTF